MTEDRSPPLRVEEALEIWRAGRRAAVAGHAWSDNPFLTRANMPAATGEALAAWSAKHDAWQEGFEAEDLSETDIAAALRLLGGLLTRLGRRAQ